MRRVLLVALFLWVGCSSSPTPRPPALPTPATAGSSTSWWKPGAGPVQWQWELDHPLDLSSSSDMGTDKGQPAPTVYDLDGFITPASTVAALHARGDRVICYIEVGAAENYRPDYRQFPAAVLGKKVPDYGSERYLDIRNRTVMSVIKARVAMCAQKGFDAVEPDIDDSFSDQTGFPVTLAVNVVYDKALGSYAHSLGLAFGQKNGDATPAFSSSLAPVDDFLLDEQCFQYGTCQTVAGPYLALHKMVLEAEYSLPLSAFCRQAAALGINADRFDAALAGAGRQTCRGTSG